MRRYHWLVFLYGAEMDFLIKILEAILAFLKRTPEAAGAEPEVHAGRPDTTEPALPVLLTEQLTEIYGCSQARAQNFAPHLLNAMALYDIKTPLRMAHFLAQVGHESGRLQYTREIWGPTAQQRRYERDFDAPWPETAAQARQPEFAKNRLAFNLGNVEYGDGSRYRGRGLIQLTGRANYIRSGSALGYNFVDAPEIAERAEFATLTAAEFWAHNGCNALADADDVVGLTKRINGGENGLADRKKLLEVAKRVLGA